MSTATLPPTVVSPLMEGGIPVPLVLPQSFAGFMLPITARGFSYLLDAPLVEAPKVEAGKLTAKFSVDDHVIFTLTLFGRQVDDGSEFRAESYTLRCTMTEPRARPQFVAATIISVFGLAGRIGLTVADLGLKASLDFKLSLGEIGNWVKRRQIAYMLLVVEKARGKEFGWPEICTLEELGQLTRTYHAIMDRVFVGPVDPVSHRIPATKGLLPWLDSFAHSPRKEFQLPDFTSILFKQSIPFGDVKLILEDAYIVDSERLRDELITDDGHEVEVVITSTSGMGLFETPNAPRLPDSPWDSKLEALISLEEAFDEELAERYDTLAAATLSGATEEEKALMTARPELDVDAFSAED